MVPNLHHVGRLGVRVMLYLKILLSRIAIVKKHLLMSLIVVLHLHLMVLLICYLMVVLATKLVWQVLEVVQHLMDSLMIDVPLRVGGLFVFSGLISGERAVDSPII
jgi:hypothetical protein